MSSPSTILYMSFFKLSFILQSIPSDIKNSSCRLFHLTLDFITHTSLVSYPNLQCPLLQFISGRKKKKDNLSSIPRVPLFILLHPYKHQFGVGAKSDGECNL